MMKVDYVIRNHKNVYIRLNQNGAPVTCTESDKSTFEYSKAMNILNGLPKTLKRLNFKVEVVPDIGCQAETRSSQAKVIENNNFVVTDKISQWIEKFGICDDILKEAQKRKEELIKELSNIDKQFSNLVHEIEFEGKIDLYGGWQERNKIKENREERRNIKNELLIISSVVKMDFRNLDREIIDKVVTGLGKRKFTYRIIEEEDTESVM